MAKVDRLIAPLIVSLVVSLAAAGCGGGGSSGPTAPTTSVISGSAQQGYMVQSTVQAYSVNSADGSNEMVLASTTTDSTGFFKLSLKPQEGPVRLVVSGGSFPSEADGAAISSPGTISVLLSSAPAGSVAANRKPPY